MPSTSGQGRFLVFSISGCRLYPACSGGAGVFAAVIAGVRWRTSSDKPRYVALLLAASRAFSLTLSPHGDFIVLQLVGPPLFNGNMSRLSRGRWHMPMAAVSFPGADGLHHRTAFGWSGVAR